VCKTESDCPGHFARSNCVLKCHFSGWFVSNLSRESRTVTARLGTLLAQRGFGLKGPGPRRDERLRHHIRATCSNVSTPDLLRADLPSGLDGRGGLVLGWVASPASYRLLDPASLANSFFSGLRQASGAPIGEPRSGVRSTRCHRIQSKSNMLREHVDTGNLRRQSRGHGERSPVADSRPEAARARRNNPSGNCDGPGRVRLFGDTNRVIYVSVGSGHHASRQ
jgi:hypothetical protein